MKRDDINIITILARRPRRLRAKINLASKEMSVLFGCVSFGWDSHVRGQICAFRSAWLGCFRLKLTVCKLHIICAHGVFFGTLGVIRNIRQTYENDHETPKNHENFRILSFWNFEFSKLLFKFFQIFVSLKTLHQMAFFDFPQSAWFQRSRKPQTP